MKAVICPQFGAFEDVEYGEFPDPVPGPGDVLLSIKVAALGAVEIGRLLDARVIASVGSDDKMDLLRRHGAEEVFNYTGGVRAPLKSLTQGRGADVREAFAA